MSEPEPERRVASVGDEVVLTLPSRSGGGHVWSVASVGEGMEVVSEELVAPPAETGHATGSPGAEGRYTVRLRAVSPGEWRVVLRLAREWEAGALEERVVVIDVT